MLNKKYISGKTFFIYFLLNLFFIFNLSANENQSSNSKTVIIAFFENGQFQSGAYDGALKNGYAYEYYRKLASITGWTYEYIYGDWDRAYNAFLNGKADLIAGMPFDTNLLDKMNFPNQPMGYEKYIIYKNSGDNEISDDIKTLSGKKIGTLSGPMENYLRQWLSDKKIESEVIVFGDIRNRDQALAHGDIHAFIGESTGVLGGFETAFTLKGVAYYIAVAKDRTDLLSELNDAQNKIYEENRFYLDYLHKKYFKQTAYARSLSSEEKNWLKNHKVLNIGYKSTFMPYSAEDKNGNVTGIVKDIFPEMLENVGYSGNLKYNFTCYSNYDDMFLDLHKGKLDVIFPMDSDISLGEKKGIFQTDILFQESANLVFKGSYSENEIKTIAVEKNIFFIENYVRKHFKAANINFYNNVYECLQAVNNGESDGTILTGLSTSSILSRVNYPLLKYIRCKDSFDISIGVCENDVVLLRLLDHCIQNMDESLFLDLSYKYNENIYTQSFKEFILEHIFIIFLIILFIFVALSFAFLFYIRSVKVKKESDKKQQEHVKVVSSLSRDFLNVFLISISNKTAVTLKLEGHITPGLKEAGSKSFPYFPMCKNYIEERVYIEDQEMMFKVMDLENLCKQLKTNKEYIGTYRVLENNEICFYQYKYILSDEDQIIAGFQNIDNIVKNRERQRMELEKALHDADMANKAKSSFLFNMSHDIRTPMNAILGFADLAKKYQDDKTKQSDYLNKIKSSSEVLMSILNNVLEMARIENGTLFVDEQALDTSSFYSSLMAIFEEQISAKNLQFESKFNIQNRYVYSDPVKIREIYMNIISNAIKYTMPGGNILIQVDEVLLENGWTSYKTSITDNGIGMSEEFLQKIYDEFSREHNSEKNIIEGTGLGMSITKRFIDLLGGTIQVQSKPGKGTTFTFVIPHRIAKEESLLNTNSNETLKSDFSGKRILLAEDNDLNAEISIEILKAQGFKVERAEDGKACVQMLKEKDAFYYDLILMDIQMPVLDGYQATREIRKLGNSDKANIPILALTANAFEEDKKNAFDSGMNGHISKPINIEQLMKVISEVVKTEKNVESSGLFQDFIDPVTGTYNSKFLELKKYPKNISAIALFEIDSFVNINEKYGTVATDDILKIVSDNVLKHIWFTDFLIRLENGKFLIIFEKIEKEDLQSKLEKICKAIENLIFEKYEGLKIALNFGSVMAPSYNDEILKTAQLNLNLSKENNKKIIIT